MIKSYLKCIEKGVSPELNSPLLYLPKEELEKKVKNNEILIKVFKDCTKKIVKKICHYIFLLTDHEGWLLEFVYNKKKYKNLSNYGITQGISLREESCGINAISLSLSLMTTVRVSQDHHYCKIFKNWDCLATPLKINGTTIGCLDISSIGVHLSKETEDLLELLAYKIISEYLRLKNQKEHLIEELNDKQIKILKLSSEGYKELAIASELKISISTVKYHKKEIVKKMKAKNFNQALTFAIKSGLI